ncbi:MULTISPECIES: hypothetical protein [Bacillus]|uniref:hypothetical protein n=1 Tax=Bacillus TaxID=1386 RepID=UPI001C213713|nr:hypothetical protein [Bacillus paralicheniformis]MBU8582195.1 hypothetical protein [Bacillus paralicheniformis]MCY8150462.1 hypothetical protein [Bacillus paralicheniformis]MCY9421604.1 hypothetical protein [Bacillus paralicheniformis]MEC0577204.1 hypothetical protein [Bacillus paralicheniformis]
MTVSKKTKTEAEKAPLEEREALFYIEDLREHAKELFGIKPEVLDGALFHVKEEQISKLEASQLIQTFLAKEVMN